ncbi:MAG TPA: hypothetical protein VN703_00215 [Candidatus Sulfopaludibacter sp.]|nr:hypothetical protein [Candidatus Sulfopaludibacter sp.]
MALNNLLTPLPKEWLNINVNSINAEILNVRTLSVSGDMSVGHNLTVGNAETVPTLNSTFINNSNTINTAGLNLSGGPLNATASTINAFNLNLFGQDGAGIQSGNLTQTLTSSPTVYSVYKTTSAYFPYSHGSVIFNASGFSIGATGLYCICASIYFSPNDNGSRAVALSIGGSVNPLISISEVAASTGGNGTHVSCSGLAYLNSGSIVQILIRQNSGSSLTIGDGSAGDLQCMAQCMKLY